MRYFLAALSALVLVLPASSQGEAAHRALATKHFFTVRDYTGPMPNCPRTACR